MSSSTHLATPGRIAVAFLPALGFLIIPFLPFAHTPTLWFGLPAVGVWSVLMVLLSVLALQLVDWHYRTHGGDAEDDAEDAESAALLAASGEVRES